MIPTTFGSPPRQRILDNEYFLFTNKDMTNVKGLFPLSPVNYYDIKRFILAVNQSQSL